MLRSSIRRLEANNEDDDDVGDGAKETVVDFEFVFVSLLNIAVC